VTKVDSYRSEAATLQGSIYKKKDTFYSQATNNNFEDWVIFFNIHLFYHITRHAQYYPKYTPIIYNLQLNSYHKFYVKCLQHRGYW